MMLIAAVAIVALAASVHADVVMVYSIQRHGARNQLPKTSLLKESASLAGPTLLPLGERLCYNAGVCAVGRGGKVRRDAHLVVRTRSRLLERPPRRAGLQGALRGPRHLRQLGHVHPHAGGLRG